MHLAGVFILDLPGPAHFALLFCRHTDLISSTTMADLYYPNPGVTGCQNIT